MCCLAPSSIPAPFPSMDESRLITKEDIDNYNKDGGAWAHFNGKVYDLKAFEMYCASRAELQTFYEDGVDVHEAFEKFLMSGQSKYFSSCFLIGHLFKKDTLSCSVSKISTNLSFENSDI